MPQTGKHRIYRFSSNLSASIEPVAYSIKGAKFSTIKNFKDANTNVLASLDPTAFPSASTQTIPAYVPKALSWGPTWGSSVVVSPDSTTRRFYNVNMNQVYASEWQQHGTTQAISSVSRVGAVTIPIYWSTVGQQSNLLSASVDPIIKVQLAESMSYLSSSELGEKLYFPMGTFGSDGLASLTLNSTDFGASTWSARQTDLRSEYNYTPGFQQRFEVQSRTSDKYVVISQYNGGVAFYNTSSLEWLGTLQLPRWYYSTASPSSNKVLTVQGISVREFEGTNYLAAYVDAQEYRDADAKNLVPKVLLYDVDAVDPADLSDDVNTYTTPANTAVPIGVIFGSGSVVKFASSPPATLGYDAGTIPGTEISLDGSTSERALCAVALKYWAEIYDISHLVFENSQTAGDENSASITSSYEELTSSYPGTKGLDIPKTVPTLSKWLDTFAISASPSETSDVSTVCANEGPPRGARARHSWGEYGASYKLSEFTFFGGVCFAGSYLLLGGRVNIPQGGGGDGFAVLPMESSSISLADFKVNFGGQLAAQLGMTSHMETYSDLTFISSSNTAYGGWVAGTVRASLGVLVAQLPPEDDLTTINLALHHAVGAPWVGSCTGAAWEPTGASGLLPDGEQYSSSYYRYPGIHQGTAMFYSPSLIRSYQSANATLSSSRCDCTSSYVPDPALTVAEQYLTFEVNVNTTLAWNAWYPDGYPDEPSPALSEFNTHGGFEALHAVTHEGPTDNRSDDVIFVADRASNATYAFSGHPGSSCTMLDKTDWINLRNQGVAVASSSLGNKSLVACVSQNKFMYFAYWDDSTKTFDTDLAASSSFLRVPTCFPAPGYPASSVGQGFQFFGAHGIKAPVQGSNPVEISDDVTHVWGSLGPSLTQYATYFDIMMVSVEEVENNTPDAKGFLDCTASLSRFRRVPGTPASVCNTKVKFADDSSESLRGKLTIWDAKQVGKYVISFVGGYAADSSTMTENYVAVHELTWSQETGTDPEGSPGFDADDVMYWTTQGEPTEEILVAKPIRIIPLTDYSPRIFAGGEGNTITLSPNKDYIAASNTRGTYLLYTGSADLSSSDGYPKPVGGLSLGGVPSSSGSAYDDAQWRGWRKGVHAVTRFGGTISDALAGATKTARTAKAPAWPLVDINNNTLGPPSDPTNPSNPGTPSNPGQIPFFEIATNVCHFRQSGDDLYLYTPTIPWTMWRVLTAAAEAYDPWAVCSSDCSEATEVLEFVGAIDQGQIDSRPRYAVRLRDRLYWFGDIGGFVT